MADNKEIEIKLAATGGGEAAKEVGKVEEAVVDLGGSVERQADALDLLGEAMEGLAGDPGDLDAQRAAVERVADAIAAMSAELEASGVSAADVAEAMGPLREQLDAARDAVAAREEEMAAAFRATIEAAAQAAEDARAAEAALEGMAEATGRAAEAVDALARGDAGLEQKKDAVAALADQIRDLEAALRTAGAAEQEVAEATGAMRTALDAATEAVAAQAEAEREEAEAAEEATGQQDLKRAALGKLNRALDGLIPGYRRVRGAVESLTAAWKASGTAGASFGSRLVAMAGGPVGIAIAALAGLAAVAGKLRRAIQDADGAIASAREAINGLGDDAGEQATALDEAGTAAGKYGEALAKIAEGIEGRKAAWEEEIDRTNRLKAAMDAAAKAAIDLQVERGEISREEGAARKGEIDIAAERRAVAAEQVKAANEKALADAEVARTKRAEGMARAQAERERKAEEDETRRLKLAKRDAETQVLTSEVIRGTDVRSREGAGRVVELLGGEEAARGAVANLEGFAGWVAEMQLKLGATAAEVIQGDGVVSALLAGGLSKEAKPMADELEKDIAADKERREALEAERQKQLAAVQATREAAEKKAAEAARRLGRAEEDAALSRDHVVPAMETRVETDRVREANRLERERKEQEAKQQQGWDKEAAGIARGIGEMVAARGPGAEQSETGRELLRVAEMLRDGTDYNEVGVAHELLAALKDVVGLNEQTKRELRAVTSEVRVLRDQIRNNPNR